VRDAHCIRQALAHAPLRPPVVPGVRRQCACSTAQRTCKVRHTPCPNCACVYEDSAGDPLKLMMPGEARCAGLAHSDSTELSPSWRAGAIAIRWLDAGLVNTPIISDISTGCCLLV
jgi:hypothetical protein